MNNGFVRWLLDVDRIPEDAEAVRLAWEHPLAGWVWFLLIVSTLGFALWSYSRIVGNRRGRGVLAMVRAGLILVVLVVLAGPMLELPRETVEEDWLLVLADRSESMQIADAPPATVRTSRDRQLESMVAETAATWAELDEDRHVLWLGFHDGVFELADADSPEEAASAGVVDFGEATGRRTSINQAIEQALQRAAARPIAGVVLFSDGRTLDPPTRSLIRRLQADQIGVYVVPLGSDEPLGDLAVRRVDAPRRAFVRDKVPVVVELDRFGDAVSEMGATVRLVDESTGHVLDEVELEAGSGEDNVTLTAEPLLAGEVTWRVEIETSNTDLMPDNNIRPFDIELVDRPLRVLYLDGYPRWEYQYLRWLLIREKSIESSIIQIGADRDFAQEGNLPITRMPRSPEEFGQFDVIIIGDVAGTFLSPIQLELIRDHVAERGAGLLWIGGERATPSSWTGSAAVLADLLPIRGSLSLARISRPVNMIPTPLADRLGVLRLVSGGDVGWPRELVDPAFRWSRLQWSQHIDPAQLKPTAQALATTSTEFDGEKLPLVIHMRYGAGQSIYVATDEIWRWRYGRGDMLPEQFWVQLIRMLGRETLAGGDDPVLLEVAPRRIAIGQPMKVSLRLLDARLADLDLQTVRAILEDQDGVQVADLELRRADGSDSVFTTMYLPDVVGPLRVRVDDSTLMAEPLLADVEVFNPENELRHPETDFGLLARLAEETGGQVLTAQSIPTLLDPNVLPRRSVRTPNPLSERIWDTPLFFLMIVVALTAEWIGRKLLRLV